MLEKLWNFDGFVKKYLRKIMKKWYENSSPSVIMEPSYYKDGGNSCAASRKQSPLLWLC
jgi:hypothetical protein